jgi:hypothetical protein
MNLRVASVSSCDFFLIFILKCTALSLPTVSFFDDHSNMSALLRPIIDRARAVTAAVSTPASADSTLAAPAASLVS